MLALSKALSLVKYDQICWIIINSVKGIVWVLHQKNKNGKQYNKLIVWDAVAAERLNITF